MMTTNREQKKMGQGSALLRHALPVTFFSVCFLYVLLVVEPTLIYHGLGRSIYYPPFRTSWQFFAEAFGTCGGPVEYLAALISHLFYFNWAGALIYTSIGFFLWLSTRSILGISRIRHVGFVSYLPVAALLVLCTGYNHQPLIILSILLGLLFFVAYTKWVPGRPLWAGVFLMVLSGGLFYLTVNGCILFWLMVVLYELILRKRFAFAGTVAVLGVAAYLACRFVFDIDMHPLHWQVNRVIGANSIKPETYSPRVLFGLYFFFPLLLVVNSLLTGKQKRQIPKHGWVSPSIQVLVLAAISVTLLKPVYDPGKKRPLKIRAFAQKRQWPKLLDYAGKDPFSRSMNILDVHDIIIALYHTDALAEQMFDWPTSLRSLTLPDDVGGHYNEMLVRRSNMTIEMGCMGISEKFAYESLINFGDQAKVLENLAVINMVKGDIQTARVFLGVLAEDLIHSGRGRYWLDILADDPSLSGNERITYLRSLVLDKNNDEINLALNYGQLLKRNPENKAAREFMMSQWLLTGDLDRFTSALNRYDTFDTGKLPRSYDQALALYRLTGGKAECRWDPTADSYEQGRKFLGIAKQCRADRKRLYHATKQEFGDSYYLYFFIHTPRQK